MLEIKPSLVFLDLRNRQGRLRSPLSCAVQGLVKNTLTVFSVVPIKPVKKPVRTKFVSVYLNASRLNNLRLVNRLTPTRFVFDGNRKFTHSLAREFTNTLTSVSRFWFIELELVGLGYRLTIKNLTIRFRLGFSHVVILTIPKSVFVLKRKKRILLYSIEKPALTLFAKRVLTLKKMSAYKVKGIKQRNQIFSLKPGKKRAK